MQAEKSAIYRSAMQRYFAVGLWAVYSVWMGFCNCAGPECFRDLRRPSLLSLSLDLLASSAAGLYCEKPRPESAQICKCAEAYTTGYYVTDLACIPPCTPTTHKRTTETDFSNKAAEVEDISWSQLGHAHTNWWNIWCRLARYASSPIQWCVPIELTLASVPA